VWWYGRAGWGGGRNRCLQTGELAWGTTIITVGIIIVNVPFEWDIVLGIVAGRVVMVFGHITARFGPEP
jgi:hypothetical protein